MTVEVVGFAVLAAGKGTRMKSDHPKPLMPLLGRPLLDFIIEAIERFCLNVGVRGQLGLVVGHQKEKLQKYSEGLSQKFPSLDIFCCEQIEQNGTAGALASYFEHLEEKSPEHMFVVCGDTPCLDSEILERMWKEFVSQKLSALCASFELDDPGSYGRIVRSPEKKGIQICEAKVANQNILSIKEVNSGLYLASTKFLKDRTSKVSQNAISKEFFLTDIFDFELGVEALHFAQSHLFQGVNDLFDLSAAQKHLLQRKIRNLIGSGVNIRDPERFYCEWDVEIDDGVQIHPGVSLYGATSIASGCILEEGVIIKHSKIGADCCILPYSLIEESQIGSSSQIGPFARLRPKTVLESDVKIGNFVETKKAHFGSGSKASHLSYIGDATIGKGSNLGCGFITCNYDGEKKHLTEIGEDVFIGSDCQLVAPVSIGDSSFIAAGSTICENVPPDSFAIARSRQSTREGMAKRFLKKKSTAKELKG